MEKEKEGFDYSYVVPTSDERREIEGIRKQYLQGDKEDKLVRLRKLDQKVKNGALILSLVLGICGTLIFGLGLTTVLEWDKLLLGICIMIVGAIPAALAYPIYLKKFAHGKNKYGAEILRISDELLNNNER